MPDVDVLAVLVAALAAFVQSSIWYAVFAGRLERSAGSPAERPPRWKLAAELLRSLILAAVLAGLGSRAGIDGTLEALLLALSLWIGFPAVLWAGALLWEGTRAGVAAIHAGDWLVKLSVVAVVVCA